MPENVAKGQEEATFAAWFGECFKRAATAGRFTVTGMVTPAMAEFVLDNFNTHNRKLHEPTVEAYAKIMLEGGWERTIDPICFSLSGKLNQGQHRLAAIFLSDAAQSLVFGFGETDAAMNVHDTGRKRSNEDTLVRNGEKNYTTLLTTSLRLLKAVLENHKVIQPISNKDIVPFLDAHPLMREAVAQGQKLHGKIGISQTGASVAYYLISRSPNVSSEELRSFWNDLCVGAIGDPKSARLALRNTLVGWDRKKVEKGVPNHMAVTGFMLRGWHLAQAGKPAAKIRWTFADDGFSGLNVLY